MAKVDCKAKLKEAFPELKAEDLKLIQDELDDARSKLFRPGTEDFSTPEFRQKAQALLSEHRFQALASRVERARNLMTLNRNLEFGMQEAYKGDPVAAAKALIAGGEVRNAKGANVAIDDVGHGIMSGLARDLVVGLKDIGSLEYMKAGANDREVAQLMWKLSRGEPLPETNGSHALGAAQVLNAINDQILRLKQNAGSMVRKLSDFITHTIHSAEKLKEAGFDKWKADILPKLNRERTFGVWSDEQIDAAMREDYNQIIRGRNDRLVPDGVSDTFISARGQSENIARKMARSRTYHFQDGYAWADYNAAYGERNLMESVISDIQRASKQVALMRQFGTNPDGAWQAWKLRMKALYEKQGATDVVKRFEEAEKGLDELYGTMRGAYDGAGTSYLARAGQAARAITAMAKLGAAHARGLRDLDPAATILQTLNEKGIASNSTAILKTYFETFKDATEREEAAHRFNIFIESYLGHQYSQFGAGSITPGRMARTMETFMNFSLLPRHFDSLKVAQAIQVGMALGDKAHLPYSEASPTFRRFLDRYGITEPEWNTIRDTASDYKGRKVIDPRGVQMLDASRFGEGSKGEQAKFEAEVKMTALFNDMADAATNTHGDRQKWFLLRGTKDEGPLGVGLRLVAQFKMPMLQEVDTFRRVVHSAAGDQSPAFLQAAASSSGFYKMAQFVAYSTVLGYAGQALVDMAQGKTPPDLHDPETWKNAMIRGGALGIYGDVLAGEANRSGTRGLLHTVAGPTLSELHNAYAELYAPTLRGETDKLPSKAFQFAWRNMPYHNLWYAKGAFDHLIANPVNDWLDPGYSQKLEDRTRSHGQEYKVFKPTGSGPLGL